MIFVSYTQRDVYTLSLLLSQFFKDHVFLYQCLVFCLVRLKPVNVFSQNYVVFYIRILMIPKRQKEEK